MTPTPNSTLQDARDWLQGAMITGAHCPCCLRWARVNPYTISSTQARALITLVLLQQRGCEWVHNKEVAAEYSGVSADDVLAATGDGLTKLRFWGLVEPKPNTSNPSKRALGLWRATPSGIAFALDRLRVPRRLWVFDNKLVQRGAPEELWGIRDALRERFDYAALLASVAPAAPNLGGTDK